MSPWKYSPYGWLPPIHSGLAVVWMVPFAPRLATCVPLT